MDDSQILALVRADARVMNGRTEIACEKALALARRAGCEPADVGRVCNDNDIRIRSCQLGCFP